MGHDTFDDDKGQKSAISGKFLHWIFGNFSPVDTFSFSPDFLFNLVRKWPQNVEKIAGFPGGEKIAESCQVSGCHCFFGPAWGSVGFGAFLNDVRGRRARKRRASNSRTQNSPDWGQPHNSNSVKFRGPDRRVRKFRQPVDPVVGDPVQQDNDKI